VQRQRAAHSWLGRGSDVATFSDEKADGRLVDLTEEHPLDAAVIRPTR